MEPCGGGWQTRTHGHTHNTACHNVTRAALSGSTFLTLNPREANRGINKTHPSSRHSLTPLQWRYLKHQLFVWWVGAGPVPSEGRGLGLVEERWVGLESKGAHWLFVCLSLCEEGWAGQDKAGIS